MLWLRWAEAGGPPVTGAPARSGYASRVDQRVRESGEVGQRVTSTGQRTGCSCTAFDPRREASRRGWCVVGGDRGARSPSRLARSESRPRFGAARREGVTAAVMGRPGAGSPRRARHTPGVPGTGPKPPHAPLVPPPSRAAQWGHGRPAPDQPRRSRPSFAELLAARPHLSMHALDGLTVEEVPLARIAAVVGSPTWVYSAGALRRRARALKAALAGAGLDGRHPLRGQGQDQPRGAARAGRRGARRRRRLGGRAARRPRRRHPGRGHRLLRRRQDRARAAPGAGRGHRPDQHRIRRGSGDALGAAPARSAARPASRCG